MQCIRRGAWLMMLTEWESTTSAVRLARCYPCRCRASCRRPLHCRACKAVREVRLFIDRRSWLLESVEGLDEVTKERDELRRENEQLRQRLLDGWTELAASEASVPSIVQHMESSLSWRVTKPLRLVRTIQLKAARVGYLRAISLSGGYLRRSIDSRRRK